MSADARGRARELAQRVRQYGTIQLLDFANRSDMLVLMGRTYSKGLVVLAGDPRFAQSGICSALSGVHEPDLDGHLAEIEPAP